MGFDKDIAETASLVNESRWRREEISHDRYAKLWVSQATHDLWQEFAREVYPYDDIELSLRNRFFLDRLNNDIDSGQVVSFVNIGAGFTSYPFLTDRLCRCMEVDQARVIDYKTKRIDEFQRQGELPPEPTIHFFPADLDDDGDVARLRQELAGWVKGKPSFILMEGLSYYLRLAVLDRLFDVVFATQVCGSALALDFWTQKMLSSPVTRRFRKFLAERGLHPEEEYTPLDVAYLASMPGYEVIELTNVRLLERMYAQTRHLAEDQNILPENYAVLRKVR